MFTVSAGKRRRHCTPRLRGAVLTGLKVNPNALGAYQMCITCVLGGIKVYGARMMQACRPLPSPATHLPKNAVDPPEKLSRCPLYRSRGIARIQRRGMRMTKKGSL